ncbi:hypothetical protein CP987_19705, partial [Morganella morganii]
MARLGAPGEHRGHRGRLPLHAAAAAKRGVQLAPHFAFGYNTTIDESLRVEWPDLARLVNTVAIEADYRYMRLRQQNEAFSW